MSSGSRRARKRGRRRGLRIVAAVAAIGVAAGIAIGPAGLFDGVLQELTLPLRHDDVIRQQAEEKGVDASLIAAVIYAESRFRDQTSHAGARGLMQITPMTAHEIERKSGGETFRLRDLSDPELNIRYGTFYLRQLLDRYEGNEVAALAAYNAGPTAVEEWGGSSIGIDDIELEETRGYVVEVLDKRVEYRREYGEELGY